ncbi:M1-family alanyl aminopeptidase, putative [Plasmodium sp. DRC-Itaito]|nr:M1-family alanyl aminopeptidase, putative [Plasmodium sp. DRC-Itaito]
MKTKQFHLYYLRKKLNLNKKIKPLKYKVHLIFLEVYPNLKYYGYCVIYFLKLSKCVEDKIIVYIHGESLRVLKCFYICPRNIERKIKKEDIYKTNEYIDIYIRNFSLCGLYKLVIWFFYENIQESIEGIYVSRVCKEGITKEKRNKIENPNLSLISLDSLNKNYIEKICKRRKIFYFPFENDKSIKKLNFKNISFEDEKNYNYISTFCEFYYLPYIFPCLQDNNHKVYFSLSVSFEIKYIDTFSFYNKKLKLDNNGIFWRRLYNYMLVGKKYDKKRKKKSKRWVLYNRLEEKEKLINKKYLYQNYNRSDILHSFPSVVTNSRIKNVYYNKRIIHFNSFLMNKNFLIKKLLFHYSNKWEHGKYNVVSIIDKNSGYALKKHFTRNTKMLKKKKKKKEMIITNKYISNNHYNNCYSKRNKKYLTYKFYNTHKIVHYNFCLFIGIYNRLYFKMDGIDIYVYIEKRNNNIEYIKKVYEYFINLLIFILDIFMKNNIFKREIRKNGFLQFMIVRRYKYVGEENANCLTFLESFILINNHSKIYDIYNCIKLSVHEIFHIIWGNSIYIKKEKYLWLKEGLTRYMEYQIGFLVLKKQISKKINNNNNNNNNINNIGALYHSCRYRCSICRCCVRRDMYKIKLCNILNSFFYVHIIDTLNIYNHALNIDKKTYDKKNICRKKNAAREYKHICDNNHKSYKNNDINSVLHIKESKYKIDYTKAMNYFYNNLTYNKGMNIFKMMYILCYPFFNIILELLYFTFYKYSITYKKILIFIHFFFNFFGLKPWFLLCSDKNVGMKNNRRKLQGLVRQSKYIKCLSRYCIKRKKFVSRDNKKSISYRSYIKWEYIKNKKPNYHNYNISYKYYLTFYKCEYFRNCCSNFLKVLFKKNFLHFYKIICTEIKGKYNKKKKVKVKQKCRYLMNKFTHLYNKRNFYCSLSYRRYNINKELLKYSYERNIFKVILRNYINVVGPPKIFLKFLKKKKKLLIIQKHFYYNNYEQRIIETPILFHVPLIFTFNKKMYKIILNKKYILIDYVNVKNKTKKKIHKFKIKFNILNKKIQMERSKRSFLNLRKCNKIKTKEKNHNSLFIRYKDGGYFSFHFVDMYTFHFLINAMKDNKYKICDIYYVLMNIILQYLTCIKSLKEAKRLNSLILMQILRVLGFLRNNTNTVNGSFSIAIIVIVEFLKCYIYFIPYLKRIENKKLTLKVKKEIKSNEYYVNVESNEELDFLFNDMRKNLSKILFFFKESINLCS